VQVITGPTGLTARLYHGDSIKLLPELTALGIDAVISDPPWGANWDNDSTRFSGVGHGPDDGRSDWPEIAGDEEPFDPTPWFDFPLVILWGYQHFAQRLPVGTVLIWLKRAPHLFGTFLSDAELAYMSKGCGVYCYYQQFPVFSRIKEGQGKVRHPNQKPIGLMRWCMQRAGLKPGATILDPYMGCGTTGKACLIDGYNFVGVEVVRQYYDEAVDGIGQTSMQPPMFVLNAEQLELM
jgi:hypothetical protein